MKRGYRLILAVPGGRRLLAGSPAGCSGGRPGVTTAASAVIAVILGAPVICGQAHHGARQAAAGPAIAAIICPPPSGDGVVAMSKSGDPGC